MQRMQRITGRFLPRTPNEADVEAMLKDFSDSQVMLEKLEASAKQWRDAWTNILNHQLSSVELLYSIFKPLGGEGSSSTHTHVETPADVLERVHGLHEAFSELKTDMMEEVKDIDRKLVVPAKLARDALKPMEKAIKKRDDAKIDYERYKSRCEALQNKKTRSERENHALAKHEMDLERSTHAYQLADENLRDRLPKLNAATFSILPHLLANQIVLQNNLIGNLYTVLHEYSHAQGYPDPPPEPEEVIPVWDSSFTPLRTEMESSLGLLKTGKAIHQPMRLPDKGDTLTGLGIRNKVIPGRRTSSNDSVPTISGAGRPARPTQTLSSTSESAPPPISLSSKPSYSSLSASKPRIGGSPHLSASQDAYGRRASSTSMASSYSNGGSDRIRVVKKTESSQDWWEGEINGRQGSFPANYCK
ncbi:SH3 domain signaling [Pyrenophora seminiperda CCB06]|uniref:SH3 domain signaling n=1 Tax=Pyrenophora seminiperda CCB06 TaxID=1302712 RepID=A0A3M7M0Q5_9PLEO|nr:SH3 domain signaling [Pyrenophora seminiperda CCB06]